MRAIMLILATIAALLFATPAQSHAAAPTAITHTVPTTHASKAVREPYMARMVNCEDYDIQPCYMYDEGSYRLVLSYAPYKAVKLSKCTEEDASAKGQSFPCIWRKSNRVAKGQPITRNVFTKNG